MSISALSFNLINDLSQQQRQNPFQQLRQDFSQLSSALQSGDLSGAQSAYSSLQKLLQSRQNSAATPGSNVPNTIQTDFAALGQALQSGDVNQARSAFSQLRSDLQARRNTPIEPPPGQDQYVPGGSRPGPSLTQQVQQDYARLAGALQSGDLSGAQSAFSNLQQALQSQGAGATQTTATSNSTTDPIANDFNTLGQALSSGNLTQAQSAFSQLKTDIQTAQQAGSQTQNLTQALQAAVQGHHHHHHGGGGTSTESSTSTTDGTDSSNGSSAPSNTNASNTTPSVNVYA
jgi:DNA-binding FadR family transcriptional regulator